MKQREYVRQMVERAVVADHEEIIWLKYPQPLLRWGGGPRVLGGVSDRQIEKWVNHEPITPCVSVSSET